MYLTLYLNSHTIILGTVNILKLTTTNTSLGANNLIIKQVRHKIWIWVIMCIQIEYLIVLVHEEGSEFS